MDAFLYHANGSYLLRFSPFPSCLPIIDETLSTPSRIVPLSTRTVLLACSFRGSPRPRNGVRESTIKRRTVRRFDDDRNVSDSPSDALEENKRPPFNINIAVVLAGFAFEAYNTPSDKRSYHEIDSYGCETFFLSEMFVREVYDGPLLIQLKKGSHFPGLDLWGTSDPYVVLHVGDSSVRSKTIWATTEPVWNESLKLNVKNPSTQYLQVAAWDGNLLTNDRRLGNAGVSLESLSDGEKHNLRVELEGMGGGGAIDLEVQYKTFCEINADKEEWKIPFLSEFMLGKGIEDAFKSTFGLRGLTAPDFVVSAFGSSLQSAESPEKKLENGFTGSGGQGSSEINTQSDALGMKYKDVVEDKQSLNETEDGNGLFTDLVTKQKNISDILQSSHLTSRDEAETKKMGSSFDSRDETDRQDLCTDFQRDMGQYVSEIMEGVKMDSFAIPFLDHITWNGIDMIRKLGLESQNKAESEYVERGLAIPRILKSDSASDESEPVEGSTPSVEEAQKATDSLLKQTEAILQSWLMLAAGLAGQKVKDEKVSGKRTAIIKENSPVASQIQPSQSRTDPVKQFHSAEEMEEVRKLFNGAETAMEAWAVLATSLGHNSLVKSAFQKICFLDNEKTDTQVALWRDAQQHRLVISFRGTEQVKWKDLRTDLMLLPVGLNPERVGGDFKEEAMVHGGFVSAYDSVRHKLMSLVRASIGFSDDESNTKCQWHIYVTGHSLGGALATLFALELTASNMSRDGHIRVTMYNFGSPRVGNKKFADQYNEKVMDSWRVVNHRDIIPTVPRLMGYCHVAQPIYLTAGDVDDATMSIELVEDGYQGDILGEATPEFLLEEFMKGEKHIIERLLQTEIAMFRGLRDGSALMQHMEDFYYISLLEKVTPRLHLGNLTKREG